MSDYNSSEYQNLIGATEDISSLLEEEFNHNLNQTSDVEAPANNANEIVTASAAVLTLGASQPLLPPIDWSGMLTPLQQSLGAIKSSSVQIATKGFAGLVSFGRAALLAITRSFGVTAIASVAIFALYKGYEFVTNAIYEFEGQIRQLEIDTASLQIKNEQLKGRIETLETEILAKLTSLETTINTELPTIKEDINTLKLDLSAFQTATTTNFTATNTNIQNIPAQTTTRIERFDGLATLSFNKIGDAITAANIAGNNADQARISANTAGTKVDEAKAAIINEVQQIGVTRLTPATIGSIVIAGVERPSGMLDQVKVNFSTATSGIPEGADSDYSSAIAAGTAVAAGTLGYAGFKNRKFLGGKIKLAMSNLNFGTILSALNLIFSIQTAMMVSRDIVETSTALIQSGINVFMNAAGLKDYDEQAINFQEKLSEGFNTIMGNLVGAQNWEALKLKYKKLNTILNAANTLMWSVREMSDNVGSLAARSCDFVAQLSNNFKSNGFTNPQFPWMSENNYRESRVGRKMTESLNNIQDTVSIMTSIMSDIETAQGTGLEIIKNKEELDKALADNPLKATPENKAVKAREEGGSTP